MSAPILYLGMDVHKDSVTVAVFAPGGNEPLLLEKLPCDLKRIRRFLSVSARMASSSAVAMRPAAPATFFSVS